MRLLTRKWTRTALFCGGVLLACQVPAKAQVAVVALANGNSVLSTGQYVAKLAGKEEEAKQALGVVNSLFGSETIPGLDMTKPWAIYIPKLPSPGSQPEIVAMLPVNKDGDFYDALAKVGVTVSREEKGIRSFTSPDGRSYYLKNSNNYLYLAQDEKSLDTLIEASQVFPTFKPNELITAEIRLDKVPAEYRSVFITEATKGLRLEMQKPSRDEAEKVFRNTMLKMMENGVTRFASDAERMGVSFSVDQQKNWLQFDAYITPKSGSAMAGEFGKIGAVAPRSLSQKNSAAAFGMKFQLPPEVRYQLDSLLEKGVKEAITKEENMFKRVFLQQMYKAVEPTLKQKEIDLAVDVSPREGGKFNAIVAAQVTEGTKIDQVVKDLLNEAKRDPNLKVQLSSGKLGEAVSHSIKIDSKSLDAGFKHFFGEDVQVAVSFTDNTAYLAISADPTAIKIADGKGTPGVLMGGEISIKTIMRLSPEGQKMLDKVDKVYTEPGSDKVRFSVQGGERLSLRVEGSSLFIKLAASAHGAE